MASDRVRYAIIVAGGLGHRMKSSTPKQFLLLKGKPLLMHTISRFAEIRPQPEIILVLPEGQSDTWKKLCREYKFNIRHSVTDGGKERFHSVKNGLKLIQSDSLVAIHDGVRPLVSTGVIEECYRVASVTGSAIPVVSPSESVRELRGDGSSRPVNRDTIRLVQTPQVFRSELIKRAYSSRYSTAFTDDATVVEELGLPVTLVAGNPENIKITTPADLAYASSLMEEQRLT